MAGVTGQTWWMARIVLDGLESAQNRRLSKESTSTTLAQEVGFDIGKKEYEVKAKKRYESQRK